MAEVPWRRVLRQMTSALRGSGLDLLAPLSVEWYNSAVPPALHLPYLGRDRSPFAILLGNSKAIWGPFISALSVQRCLMDSPHPLNSYVKQSVNAALNPFDVIDSQLDDESRAMNSKRIRAAVYWDFDTRPGKLVAMQRLAHVAGVAFFDESSNLCVHPSYGPWFALRALVLFDIDPPTENERPQLLQSSLAAGACERVMAARKRATEQEERMASLQQDSKFSELNQRRLWLAVRDAIQPNHPMRYELDQVHYHYTHDKKILHRLAAPTERIN